MLCWWCFMVKWPPDSVTVWGPLLLEGFSDCKRLSLCAQHETRASIFMLGGNPLETGWPLCGLNPIYRMLPLTKCQSLFSPFEKMSDLNTRFLEHKNTSATLSLSCYHFFQFLAQDITSLRPTKASHSLGQCGARLMRCSSDGLENHLNLPSPNDQLANH